MKAEEIRRMGDEHWNHAETSDSRYMVSIMAEIAAQLAEANEHLKCLAHPLVEVKAPARGVGGTSWEPDQEFPGCERRVTETGAIETRKIDRSTPWMPSSLAPGCEVRDDENGNREIRPGKVTPWVVSGDPIDIHGPQVAQWVFGGRVLIDGEPWVVVSKDHSHRLATLQREMIPRG